MIGFQNNPSWHKYKVAFFNSVLICTISCLVTIIAYFLILKIILVLFLIILCVYFILIGVYKSGHGEVARISQVIEHEHYNNNTLRNDIALLVLTKPIEFTTNIQPVCLPNSRIPLVDKFIKVLGEFIN